MNKSKGREETESKTEVSGATEESLKDLPIAELKKRLRTSTDGLNQQEWQGRLENYGYNEIEEKRVSPILKFLSYFRGPIPIMIIIAAVLSAVLRHWPDMGVILALLVVNAVVGFREEYQADSAIAALKDWHSKQRLSVMESGKIYLPVSWYQVISCACA
jgi:H+-transporting ATPase